MEDSIGSQKVLEWFNIQGWKVQDFQMQSWTAISNGYSGIVNAPTGSGKTYSILLGYLIEALNNLNIDNGNFNGLQLVWVAPIRALTKEIQSSCTKAISALQLDWRVEVRSGDTVANDRKKQWTSPPHILITTPESLHVILATTGYRSFFSSVKAIIVDEWHELIGSKRGVQTELFINKLVAINSDVQVWGISATIGNLSQAMDVLLHSINSNKKILVQSSIHKNIVVQSVIPNIIENFPWAGHMGLKLAQEVVHIIKSHGSTLIFTNTRAICEVWYQKLLEIEPDLAGQMAMHHGSISKDLREWVEDALHQGTIKAVVCTSSLDLGVDFRPVDAVVQIGSPKGVARFVQRAGRSGHLPGADSKIYFVPTHAIELIEAAGLRMSIEDGELENREPYYRSFDVLIQYMMTLAVSDGFYPKLLFKEVTQTFCFESMTWEEYSSLLQMLLTGSTALDAYDEFKRITIEADGKVVVKNKKIALRHKMSIGTIVSDAMITIKLIKGTTLGSIEEWFVSQLNPGDIFWFAGRAVEYVRTKEMIAQVKLSTATSGKIPSYQGGRMPLSSQMSKVLRDKIDKYVNGVIVDPEINAIKTLLQLQQSKSYLPKKDELLVEYFETKEGFHLIMYPFEGRAVHEGIAAFLAKRISMQIPVTFSIAMNDLGFELLSDKKIDIKELINPTLFSTDHLEEDIQMSINCIELAKRKFREIARISGLIFVGFPGKPKKERHLQASAQLIFEVFKSYDPNNLLYMQTYEEVMQQQLEENRMRVALQRIMNSKIVICFPDKPTPLSFPLLVDRLREKLSSEKLEDRIKRMTAEYSK